MFLWYGKFYNMAMKMKLNIFAGFFLFIFQTKWKQIQNLEMIWTGDSILRVDEMAFGITDNKF